MVQYVRISAYLIADLIVFGMYMQALGSTETRFEIRSY